MVTWLEKITKYVHVEVCVYGGGGGRGEGENWTRRESRTPESPHPENYMVTLVYTTVLYSLLTTGTFPADSRNARLAHVREGRALWPGKLRACAPDLYIMQGFLWTKEQEHIIVNSAMEHL